MNDTITSAQISEWIIERIGFYGKVDTDSVSVDTPLAELGLDSIYALTLCGDIEDQYDLEVDPTILTEHATIRELSEGLRARLAES